MVCQYWCQEVLPTFICSLRTLPLPGRCAQNSLVRVSIARRWAQLSPPRPFLGQQIKPWWAEPHRPSDNSSGLRTASCLKPWGLGVLCYAAITNWPSITASYQNMSRAEGSRGQKLGESVATIRDSFPLQLPSAFPGWFQPQFLADLRTKAESFWSQQKACPEFTRYHESSCGFASKTWSKRKIRNGLLDLIPLEVCCLSKEPKTQAGLFLNIASEINLLRLTFKNQLIQEGRKGLVDKSGKGRRPEARASEACKDHKCSGQSALGDGKVLKK